MIDALANGGVAQVELSAPLRVGITNLGINVLSYVTALNAGPTPPYTGLDEQYPPVKVDDGRMLFPYLTPYGGWQTDVPGYMDVGVRLPNPDYPGDINRNTVIHLPDDPTLCTNYPEPIPEFAREAVPILLEARKVASDIIPGLHAKTTTGLMRVIMYPRAVETEHQLVDTGEEVALKSHVDKGVATMTVFETGPGFEYYDRENERYTQPPRGSYLFEAGNNNPRACLHRVTTGLVSEGYHQDLDTRVKTALDRSPYARLAIIAFSSKSE